MMAAPFGRPEVSRRVLRVWGRNAAVYRKIWKVNFLPPLLEPLFYILAFGVGFSGLVGGVPWRGGELPYVSFIAPALVAVAVMYNSFFETTYASFVRMYYQKTFDAMLATPLTIDEVITGEILWGATRSLIAAGAMMAVLTPFGLLRYPSSLLILPLALLGGVAFGSAGMFFTGLTRSIDNFNLPVFLFITPMFLLSGTFFPLEGLPAWAAAVARLLPLTHLTRAARELALGPRGVAWAASAAYLAAFAAVFYLLALRFMRRRLIV